jgi:hypothetical protein
MAVAVMRTMASVGSTMVGSGTVSTRTSSLPCQQSAFMIPSRAPVPPRARRQGAGAAVRPARGRRARPMPHRGEVAVVSRQTEAVSRQAAADARSSRCPPDERWSRSSRIRATLSGAGSNVRRARRRRMPSRRAACCSGVSIRARSDRVMTSAPIERCSRWARSTRREWRASGTSRTCKIGLVWLLPGGSISLSGCATRPE